MNEAPPLENCTITGDLALAPASITALIESVPTQFTEGNAKPFSRAKANNFCKFSPVTAPGFTISRILVIRLSTCKLKYELKKTKFKCQQHKAGIYEQLFCSSLLKDLNSR